MGRWTYYSPLLLLTLAAALSTDTFRPLIAPQPVWLHYLQVAGICLGLGLMAQVAMVGAQGAFAQVLPVPGGRSIRGRAAGLAGWLLIAAVAFSVVGMLLAGETLSVARWIVIGLAGASVVWAGLTFLWSLPTAERDFDLDDSPLAYRAED